MSGQFIWAWLGTAALIAFGIVAVIVILWFVLGMPGKRLSNAKNDDYGAWRSK